jgi:hypothetical protein
MNPISVTAIEELFHEMWDKSYLCSVLEEKIKKNGRVKQNNIKLVFVASPLRKHH